MITTTKQDFLMKNIEEGWPAKKLFERSEFFFG